MTHTLFYTPLSEEMKIGLYVLLMGMVFIGLIQKRRQKQSWADWIHVAIFIHFLIGAFYSGIRMVTTDAINQMLIRRIFACEAWFNFACAAFYFLALESRKPIRS